MSRASLPTRETGIENLRRRGGRMHFGSGRRAPSPDAYFVRVFPFLQGKMGRSSVGGGMSCASLPLVGRDAFSEAKAGWGPELRHPTPAPSPRGGGEQIILPYAKIPLDSIPICVYVFSHLFRLRSVSRPLRCVEWGGACAKRKFNGLPCRSGGLETLHRSL